MDERNNILIVKCECGGLTSGMVERPLSVAASVALEIQTESLQNSSLFILSSLSSGGQTDHSIMQLGILLHQKKIKLFN